MRAVSIVGSGQLQVRRTHQHSLRQLGAQAANLALSDAGLTTVDALYLSNMLSDELQCQKHLAALVADEAGLHGIEAIQIRAATASGAAALRVGYLAVASGAADSVLVVGVEKMSGTMAAPVMTKALDAQREVPDGATLLSMNADMMSRYQEMYSPPQDALALFTVNAHNNARNNPNALFSNRQLTTEDVRASRIIVPPLRLLDCSPVCEGAAGVVLVPADQAERLTKKPIHIVASAAATDRFRPGDRAEPLLLEAARSSSRQAMRQAGLSLDQISLFEAHDAFSIMTCLAMEAVGFAAPGQGWRPAVEDQIGIDGKIPLCTMGGLKARGHPIGATALYQTCEIVLQLTERAGENQVPGAKNALMQSIGALGTTIITHVLSNQS